MNERAALTRWLNRLGRVAATSWLMAPSSFGGLLVRHRAGRAACDARR